MPSEPGRSEPEPFRLRFGSPWFKPAWLFAVQQSQKRIGTMTQWVYTFGDGKAEGDAGMKNLLGGKGANLAEMSNLGLPVPPGFTITTEVCTYYYDHGQSYPTELTEQVAAALAMWAAWRIAPSGMRKTRCWSRCAPAPALDAGHDGHGAQPRAERQRRGRGRRARRGRALRL